MSATDPDRVAPPDLSLRAPAPAVLRLSRRTLVLLVGAGALALATVLGFGLMRRPMTPAAPPLNLAGPPPDALNALPRDYGAPAPPRLGPPLPGDLGAPILSAGAPAPPMGVSPTAIAQASPVVPRPLSPEATARQAGLFFGVAATPETAAARDPAAAFTSAHRLTAPAAPHVLQAGAVIVAALVGGVDAEAPGQVVAQVTEPAFDSLTGQVLLVPQGARLIGGYDSQVRVGQSRLALVWRRLILPDGRSLALDDLPGADAQGRVGLRDRVDQHWGRLFGMAALSTLLGAGLEAGSRDEDRLAEALRRGAAGTANQVGQQATAQGLTTAPTLVLRPGTPVRVQVLRDLVLEPYLEKEPAS